MEDVDTNDVVRRVLADERLSQDELAHALGVTTATVNRWVNRRVRLDERKLRRHLKALGIDPEKYGMRPSRAAQWGVDLTRGDIETSGLHARLEQLEAALAAANEKLDILIRRG